MDSIDLLRHCEIPYSIPMSIRGSWRFNQLFFFLVTSHGRRSGAFPPSSQQVIPLSYAYILLLRGFLLLKVGIRMLFSLTCIGPGLALPITITEDQDVIIIVTVMRH